MKRSDVLAELRTLGFSVALVLVGTVVVQLTGWSRLWVLLAALTIGFTARAGVRAVRRRTPASAPPAL